MRRFGSGPGRALMLHCSLAHGGVWKPVVAPLADRLTCIAPDMPGHGRSAPWDGIGEVHDAVTDSTRGLLDRPCHIVGHSFGATVAIRLAIERPDMVLSLTLIEPVIVAIARGTGVFEAYRAQLKDYLEANDRQDWRAMALAFHAAWGGGKPWAAVSKATQDSMIDLMPMIGASEGCLTEDSCNLLGHGRLERLTMPITLLRGSETQDVVRVTHQKLQERLPHAVEAVVDGAGHMLPITHPDAVTQAIAAHLGAVVQA
ncbi:pimeloyl-ACP methyl ester carboxylesterase [Pelagimonas varians]|uniref:Dihydrolipoyllysine-residue acetyltransferase component of acetoin cleaving system n=1 Tax=Pelagimonas varians TaxID=696760 RepID=A0A238L3H6_9RHOB|nr:pimeloyl-ACP methyl ester carboxylesterase [Pelagimonas varians]SMX48886.1 Dihydrolipoyllysine-residue acetyltransferase component of acetoin cleaving system [Pelagimonas varians]